MENIFIEGMIYKTPRENAPQFIRGHLSVNVEKFLLFARANVKPDGWLNIDIKQSKQNKIYLTLNNYRKKGETVEDLEVKLAHEEVKPETDEEVFAKLAEKDEIKPEDLPF